MSIHELAKEIGVSEYALKKYGKENGVFRAGDSSRYGYEFSKKDLQKIKADYKRFEHKEKKTEPFIWIFYKCIFQPGNIRYSTPVGRFEIEDEALLKEFIHSQKYVSAYGKIACHFELVNNHTALLRISKIFNTKIDENFDLETVSKALPLKIEDVQEAIKAKNQISQEELFGEKLSSEKIISTISLDDLAGYTILSENNSIG